MEVRIKERRIGDSNPVFIVAEVGTNHNGRVDLALEIVDRAAEIGADAVKFQPVDPRASYIEGSEAYRIYSRVWLGIEEWVRIKERAEKNGLVFFAAPADIPGARMMQKLGLPLVKISSPSMTNVPLQDTVAELGVPVMVSTGMAYLGEIEKVVRRLTEKGVREIILLHCVSVYPSPPECANLNSMKTMMEAFPYPVGYSDHTIGDAVCVAAVALGAKAIEKHFTLDHTMEGPEHAFSADFEDFRVLVKRIREVEASLGSRYKGPCAMEMDKRQAYRRCLVAECDIPKGTVITAAMVGLKRPSGKRGLETDFYYDVLGRVAARDIHKDEPIGLGDI